VIVEGLQLALPGTKVAPEEFASLPASHGKTRAANAQTSRPN